MNKEFLIWYPGSGYASQEWIDYLQKLYNGNWIYSDNSPNWHWNVELIPHFIQDTFEAIEKNKVVKKCNQIIISWHPGLKDFDSIKNLLLNFIKPEILILDLGFTDVYNTKSLRDIIPLFEKEHYILNKIEILPNLNHQIGEFNLIK